MALLAFVLLFLGLSVAPEGVLRTFLVIGCIAFGVASTVIYSRYCRCPHCGVMLARIFKNTCTECGEDLNKPPKSSGDNSDDERN